MTYEAAANFIRAKWISDIENAPLPTAHDNFQFDEPSAADWARLSVKEGKSFQVSLGSPDSNRWRTPGVMFGQIFVLMGSGDKVARQYARRVLTTFQGKTINGVSFRAVSIETVGRTGKWWQVNVSAEFYYDDLG